MSDDYVPPTVAQMIDGLESEVERAIAERQHRGKGGQTVSFQGDFAGCALSSLLRLRWWVRELRAANERDEAKR